MASILNADDGVVSGSAGLKSNADSSGVLALQTNGTTAVTVNASQNVTLVGSLTAAGLSGPHNGTVGATTPAAGAFTTLSASGATTLSAQLTASTGDTSYPIISKDTSAFSAGVSGSKIGFFGLDSTSTNTALGAISTLAQASQDATLRVQVLNSGSLATIGTFSTTGLGIGTSSLFTTAANRGNISLNGTTDAIFAIGTGGTRRGYIYADSTHIEVVADGYMALAAGGAERARITSAGDVGIGTSSPGARLQVVSNVTSSYGMIIYNQNATGQGLTIRAGSTSSQDAFNCQTYDGGISLFAVQSGGNVGIGTSSPTSKLDVAGIISDSNGNVRKVPQSGSSKTSSYTLATTDVGEYILLGASGAIVIPDATFAAGDIVTIFNNTASTATITCSITTAYIAGTFTDKATMTLAAAGVATVLFITSTLCVVSGNVT